MFRTLAIKFYNWLFPSVYLPATTYEVKETVMNRAEIIPTGNGRFALVRRGYGTLNTYARARDARRGAARLGLVV